jgi:phospholipase/carboxylesterase
LTYVERPAAEAAEGAFVLVHGRGANEHDLFGLFDALDPERRLHGYSPRGPLPVPPGGAQWYVIGRVGYPEPSSFAEGYAALRDFVEALPYDRIVLGGFSQGAVMSLAVGLGHGRPRPEAILAFSGFVPIVEGWELDASRAFPPIALAHGTFDPIIPVELAHRSLAQLEAAGAEVLYRESPIEHAIDPAVVAELQSFLSSVTASSSSA